MELLTFSPLLQAIVIICYFLFAFGLAECLVYYEGFLNMFGKIRDFANWIHPKIGAIFNCIVCTSCWIGLVASALDFWLIPVAFTPWNVALGFTHMWYIILPMDCFTTCAFVMLLNHIDEAIVKKGEEVIEPETIIYEEDDTNGVGSNATGTPEN